MVVEYAMRYLILALALLLAACGTRSDPESVKRVDTIVQNCGGGDQLQCVTEALTGYCHQRYEARKLTDFESWSDCWIGDLAEYCQRPYQRETTEKCVNDGIDVILPSSPYWPILEAALNTAWNACDSRRKTNELASEVAKAECINEGYERVFRQYRFLSLVDKYPPAAAKRMELAKRLDSGSITKEQAEREWRKYVSGPWREYLSDSSGMEAR